MAGMDSRVHSVLHRDDEAAGAEVLQDGPDLQQERLHAVQDLQGVVIAWSVGSDQEC